jgi:hypothetical protein
MEEDWSANCKWIRVCKYDWTKEASGLWGMDEESDMDSVCYWIYSTCAVSTLLRKLLKDFKNFKKIGQVICIVKYADDFVLLAKEEIMP